MPDGITLPPPARSTETDPAATIGQLLRDDRLSNCVLRSCGDMVDHCCEAWNALVGRPWRGMTLGRRERAHGV